MSLVKYIKQSKILKNKKFKKTFIKKKKLKII